MNVRRAVLNKVVPDVHLLAPNLNSGFVHQAVDLVEAIAAGRQPEPSFADGLQIQRVLDAVERSAQNQSTWTPVETQPTTQPSTPPTTVPTTGGS